MNHCAKKYKKLALFKSNSSEHLETQVIVTIFQVYEHKLADARPYGTMADPRFPRGGGANRRGGATYDFVMLAPLPWGVLDPQLSHLCLNILKIFSFFYSQVMARKPRAPYLAHSETSRNFPQLSLLITFPMLLLFCRQLYNRWAGILSLCITKP